MSNDKKQSHGAGAELVLWGDQQGLGPGLRALRG